MAGSWSPWGETLAPEQSLEAYVERLFPEAGELFTGPLPEGEAEAARLAFALRDSGADLYRLRPAVRVVELLVSGGR